MQATASAASVGDLNLVLEQNQALNFRREFVVLYSAWASFEQAFLISSLISTEVWYRFNRFGSLVISKVS